MIEYTSLLCYLAAASAVAFPGLGVALGQGGVTSSSLQGIVRQPYAHPFLLRAVIFALALSETSALLSTVIALLVLLGTFGSMNTLTTAAALGALACAGYAVGRHSAGCARASLDAIAQNPPFAARITGLMLLNLSLLQTPYILVLMTSWIALQQSPYLTALPDDLRWTAALVVMGLSALGPIRGIARFAAASAQALIKAPQHADTIFTFTFISQAIIETPILFALIISLLLMSYTTVSTVAAGGVVCFMALAFSVSCIVTCRGTSSTAAAACKAVAEHPEMNTDLLSLNVGAQALIDTNVIYALMVALTILLRIR